MTDIEAQAPSERDPRVRKQLVDYVQGPIVSCSDLNAHCALFAAFGLTEVEALSRTADEVRDIWGIDGQSCDEVMLETPGTPFGVRLLRFTPGAATTIRSPERGQDYDALKVIDFYAPNLCEARAVIEAEGFRFKEAVAEYETPEGRFQEAHLWGPDGVVCALISGDPDFFRDFVTVRDRLVSEPLSISGPVRDPNSTLSFFNAAFGLSPLHTYGVHDDSFQALVGTANDLRLRAWNVGPKLREPYFGVIDYGLPESSQASLFSRSRPPARGLLGATLVVPNLSKIEESAAASESIGPVETRVPRIGIVRMLTLRGPNGGWYQAVEPVEERRR